MKNYQLIIKILGIGDPAALGPDGHGSVDLQNTSTTEPTEDPTSIASSTGPLSMDREGTTHEGKRITVLQRCAK